MARQASAYPGFCSMKWLRVFLLPPGWVTPQHWVRRYPFIHLGGERHCESKVSCPRTQHNVPCQGSKPGLHDLEMTTQSMRKSLAQMESNANWRFHHWPDNTTSLLYNNLHLWIRNVPAGVSSCLSGDDCFLKLITTWTPEHQSWNNRVEVSKIFTYGKCHPRSHFSRFRVC